MKLKAFCLLTAALLIVCAALPGFAAKDPAERKIASVDGGALKLRAKASSKADILGTYATGTLVNVLDDSNKTWYQVEVNGKTGYMMAKYLTEVTTYRHQAWATAGDGKAIVSLYASPDGTVTYKTTAKCLLEVTRTENGWAQVRSGSDFLYIPESEIAYTEQDCTITGYMGVDNTFSTSFQALNPSLHDTGSQKSLSSSGASLSCDVQYPVFTLGRTDATISNWVQETIASVTADARALHENGGCTLTLRYNTIRLDENLTETLLFGEYRTGSAVLPIFKAFTVDMQQDALLEGRSLIRQDYTEDVLTQLRCRIMRLFNEYSGGYEIPVTASCLDNAYLDLNGLTFLFAPGELLPVRYGTQRVTLPYLQVGDLLAVDSPIVNDNKRHIDPTKPMVALTFDDGPSEFTYQILDALETYGGRATFCMVGTRLGEFSNVVKAVVAQQSEIASHTWNHKKLTELSAASAKKQISQVNDRVMEIAGYRVTVLRPPYGTTNTRVRNVCKELGMTIAFWTVDTEDWITRDADKTYNRILQGAGPGVIILCHDIYESTAEAAVRAIPELIQNGYQLVTMSELLSFHKDGPVPGTVYMKLDPENVVTTPQD